MAMKDVPDALVCKAYAEARANNFVRWPYEMLSEWTRQPEKVCFRAMERACDHGLIEYGVSLRTGWLTDKGRDLLGDRGAGEP
jgi:hypothetical protein